MKNINGSVFLGITCINQAVNDEQSPLLKLQNAERNKTGQFVSAAEEILSFKI